MISMQHKSLLFQCLFLELDITPTPQIIYTSNVCALLAKNIKAKITPFLRKIFMYGFRAHPFLQSL